MIIHPWSYLMGYVSPYLHWFKIDDAILSAIILIFTLALFVSEKLRHDAVALLALFISLLVGLVSPADAFSGFSDPAVITVAAILVVGRAIELTGVATAFFHFLAPESASFPIKLIGIMLLGAILSAFMNNIAALAITIPAAVSIARQSGYHPGATLMPLSFATILGGVTTLVGTPANLILSSIRQSLLGHGFGFFDMTFVGCTTTLAGLLYLALIGWRLLPQRKSESTDAETKGMLVFELIAPIRTFKNLETIQIAQEKLRNAKANLLAVIRDKTRASLRDHDPIHPGDHLLVSTRLDPWSVARKSGYNYPHPRFPGPDAITSRVVVGYGSILTGASHAQVAAETTGEVRVIAAGPRAAKLRTATSALSIEPGDQLHIHGSASAISKFVRYARLLEINREDKASITVSRAITAVGIYAIAVIVTVVFGISTSFTFLAAAMSLCLMKFLPTKEIYRSIDWPIIVLLGAMIPVGQSFEKSGAASIVAQYLSDGLGGMSLFWIAAAMVTVTMLLSIFLNNVATAIIIGPIAVKVASDINVNPDALLLAVLVGASSDFLTPIGHQNNLLVMGPGEYRFSDYSRVGALLALIVILTTAWVLNYQYQ